MHNLKMHLRISNQVASKQCCWWLSIAVILVPLCVALLANSRLATAARTSKHHSKARAINDTTIHEREFVSAQVRVQLDCSRDKTVVRLNFTKPFNGIVGAGKLDTTKCKLNGNGAQYYELHVAHNATQCDTQWDKANSSILNTLFVQFHPSLETGADLAKNVMCRLTVGDLVVGRKPIRKAARPASGGQ